MTCNGDFQIGDRIFDDDDDVTGTVIRIAYGDKRDGVYEKRYLIKTDKFRLFAPSTYWTSPYDVFLLDYPRQ